MRIPRFHSLGENDGHFYAVAYVFGNYVPPTAPQNGEAFFVLDFSPSKNFSRFSFSTVSPDGHMFAYTRGSDDIETVEYALLRAWQNSGVPPHAWRLFPSASVVKSDFGGDASARSAYEDARRRAALVFYAARMKQKFPAKPMFRFSEADCPEAMVSTSESQEISKYVLDYARARTAT